MSTQAISSRAFWRSYLITARPYLFFVSAAAGLVGLAFQPQLGLASFVAALSVFFVVYGLGQALTDTSQTDTDAISAPYRPLVRGVVSARQIATVSLVGLALCAVVLGVLNPWTLLLACASVAGLASYTWFKRRWWAGPLYNAWIVALLPAMGFLCGGATLVEALSSTRLLAVMVSVLFSYATFVALGYLKDISADRATGYVTLPVRFGWRRTVAVSAGFSLVALVSSAWLASSCRHAIHSFGAATLVAVALWLAGALALMAAHLTLLQTERESEAHGGIGWSVRGFVLLHLAEAALLRPALAWVALGIYASFELTLALRPERSQI